MVACAHPTRADLKDSDGGGLWFSDDLTEADASRAWDALAGALCDQWNVIGVDLMSEPYAASWGKGLITDWDRAAARLGNKVLTLTNVAVRFGDTPLFKGLTLDLPAGAVMGVVGANGTGKTSLLKLIAGEATPDEGEVSLGGTVRVGYASQTRDGLDDDKSVFEEISQVLPRTFHDLP